MLTSTSTSSLCLTLSSKLMGRLLSCRKFFAGLKLFCTTKCSYCCGRPFNTVVFNRVSENSTPARCKQVTSSCALMTYWLCPFEFVVWPTASSDLCLRFCRHSEPLLEKFSGVLTIIKAPCCSHSHAE